MNRTDFRRWWKDFSARFPDTAEWITKLDKDAASDENAVATLKVWEEVLADVAYQDAMQASKLLSTGEEERPDYSRREDTPKIIREIARRAEVGRSPSRVEFWELGYREQCQVCHDTGVVVVVGCLLMKVIVGIIRGQVPEERYWTQKYREVCANCGECALGKRRWTDAQHQLAPGRRFNRNYHIAVYHGDTESQAAVDEIFAEARRILEASEARCKQSSNGPPKGDDVLTDLKEFDDET